MSGAETIVLDAAVRLDGIAERPPLRFLTCGSVDDGKSTLPGRLLYEQNLILEDHLAALERDSGKYGTSGSEVDFSLLLDGLKAEREFCSSMRVADTPGHEQYTRNMGTGGGAASGRGIVRLFGIRHVVLTVNKIDLIGFERRVFERIAASLNVAR
jgi:bifunctional enzyme CysN/CysC